MLHLNRGEPELALQRLEAAEALVAEQRLGFVMEPQLLRGAALERTGSVRRSCRLFAQRACRPNRRDAVAMLWASQSGLCTDVPGEDAAALTAARDGLSTEEKTGHRQWKAELHRLEGSAYVRPK